MRHAQDSINDLLAEAGLPQVVGGDRRVLDHVMEDGDDLGFLALHAHHRPKRMQDVRLPSFVLLSFMGLGPRSVTLSRWSPCFSSGWFIGPATAEAWATWFQAPLGGLDRLRESV